MSDHPIGTITEFHEAGECDLCGKQIEVVVASFRTAMAPESYVCFGCLKRLVIVDFKHEQRRHSKLKKATPLHKEGITT